MPLAESLAASHATAFGRKAACAGPPNSSSPRCTATAPPRWKWRHPLCPAGWAARGPARSAARATQLATCRLAAEAVGWPHHAAGCAAAAAGQADQVALCPAPPRAAGQATDGVSAGNYPVDPHQVMQAQVSFHLPLCCHVQHRLANVQALRGWVGRALPHDSRPGARGAACRANGSCQGLPLQRKNHAATTASSRASRPSALPRRRTTQMWPRSVSASPLSPLPQPRSRSSFGVPSSGSACTAEQAQHVGG